MYKCSNCGAEFETPIVIKTTQARLFGISALNDPIIEVKLCPYCESEEITNE